MLLSDEKYTRRLQALLIILCVSSLVLVLHSLGLEYSLYWTCWWFDIVIHTLGGFSIGLLVFVLFSGKYIRFSGAVVVAVVIGWELFEALFLSIQTDNTQYVLDTVLDLGVGFLGAYAGARLYVGK